MYDNSLKETNENPDHECTSYKGKMKSKFNSSSTIGSLRGVGEAWT